MDNLSVSLLGCDESYTERWVIYRSITVIR